MKDEFECPLLKRGIHDGYCYDLNMVAVRMVKEDNRIK